MKFKVSLYLFLASTMLLALAVAEQQGRPEETSIGSIQASDIGEKILIKGEVVESYSTGESAFLTLEDDTGNISVVSFGHGNSFSEGEKVGLSGRVTLYHGKLEVVADRFYLSLR